MTMTDVADGGVVTGNPMTDLRLHRAICGGAWFTQYDYGRIDPSSRAGFPIETPSFVVRTGSLKRLDGPVDDALCFAATWLLQLAHDLDSHGGMQRGDA